MPSFKKNTCVKILAGFVVLWLSWGVQAHAFTTFYFSGPRGFGLGGSSSSQVDFSVSFWSPYRAAGWYGYGWAQFGWPHGWGRPAWGVPLQALPAYGVYKANREYAEELAQQKMTRSEIRFQESQVNENQKNLYQKDREEFERFERDAPPEIRRAPSPESVPVESTTSKDGTVTVNYY